jgi:hypothetical protein
VGRSRAGLHRIVVVHGVRVGGRELNGRAGKRSLGLAALGVALLLAVLHLFGVVKFSFGVVEVGNGLLRGVVHLHQRGGVGGVLQGIGHHEGHRLRSVKNLVASEGQEAHRRAGVFFTGRVVGRFGQFGQVLVRKHRNDAQLLSGGRGVDTLDFALGDGAGGQHAVGEAGQRKFGCVLGLAGHFFAAFHAHQRLADVAAGLVKKLGFG